MVIRLDDHFIFFTIIILAFIAGYAIGSMRMMKKLVIEYQKLRVITEKLEKCIIKHKTVDHVITE